MNLLTNSIKVIVYIAICKTKHQQIILPKDGTSFFVICFPLFCIMLRTIQLNYKPGLCTVKIYNKRFYNSLFVDFDGIAAQKQIPEFSFLWRQIAP